MKKIMSLAVILCIMASMLITPVYAAQCCHPYIAGVIQGDEKVVVKLEMQEPADVESLKVRIWHNSKDWDDYSAEEIYTISGTETAASVEFDNSLFIKDESYNVTVACDDCMECNIDHYKQFYFENDGMPLYEIGNTQSEEITFNKTDYVAVCVTADSDGIYKIGIEVEEGAQDWGIKFYELGRYNNTVDESKIYLKEQETKVFKVKVLDDYEADTIAARLTLEPVNITFADPLTKTPENGDVVYNLTNHPDPGEFIGIAVPKTGLYTIKSQAPQNPDDAWSVLYDSKARYTAEWNWNAEATEILLEEGIYYLETFNMYEEGQETTITYKKPEEFTSFGTEISLESNQVMYKSVKLDSAAFITKENKSGDRLDVSLLDDNFRELFDIRDYKNWTNVIAPDEYIIKVRAYNGGSAVITKTDIPTTVIGEQLTYVTDDNDGRHAYVKAPEKGEYVFTFLNDASIDDEWTQSGTYYIEMEKDETKLIYSEGEFEVKKHTPEYSALSFGDNSSISLAPETRQYYSFTAEEEGSYRFDINMDGAFYLKLYTDDEEIYNDDYFGNFNEKSQLKADLDANESIYFCLTSAYENNVSISINNRYTKITETIVLDCTNNTNTEEEKEFLFAPEQAGYYNFTFNKATNESSFYCMRVTVNGYDLGYIGSNYTIADIRDKFYASQAEPAKIVVWYDNDQSCTANMIFDRIPATPVTDISNFKIEDASYYSVILPETGLYKITGSAYFNATDWREEGEYPYFFDPVIKNYRDAIFSYDAQEGEAPIFFCGNKGDEILLIEESTEYYSFEYPISASITKVTAEEIQLDTLVSSNEDYKIYCVQITEDGEYKFEDFSKELYDPNAGEYGTYYGHGYATFCDGAQWHFVKESTGDSDAPYGIFELKAGTYYIAAGTYDNDKEDEFDPTSEFKISKLEKPSEELTFSDKAFTYDGNEKVLELKGTIPEGVSVAYTSNKATDAGTYQATAVVSGNGYETKTFTAVLTINKASVTVEDIDLVNETATLQGILDADKDGVLIDFDKLDTVVDKENNKATISSFVLKGDKAKNYSVTTKSLEKNVTISQVAVTTPENVQVTAQKAEGTKTIIIDTIDVSAVPEEAEKVALDMTENGAVDTVSLPKTVFGDLKDKAELEIKLTDGTVSFDKTALEAIEGAASGTEVSLKVDKPADEQLEDAQVTEKNKLSNPVVYSFNLEGVTDSQFDGGNATVTVSYEKTGSGDVKAKYLKDNGTVEAVPAVYDDAAKKVTMTLGHFSDYVIYTEAPVYYGGGGGGGVPTCTVKFETNGAEAIANKAVTRGGLLKKPEDPKKEGYTFGGWFTDKELKNAYNFDTKVTASFTLYAKWVEEEKEIQESKNQFSDVKADDWFAASVEFVSKNKLMNGVSEDAFAPYDNLSRAMLVTVLYRMEGEPEVSADSKFSDVKADSYYEKAVAWAQENNIVNGYSETEFMPDEYITREQIATIMYRYIISKGTEASEKADINAFDDAESVSEFAKDAIAYAVASGLLKGKSETTLNPKDNATRAEFATILQRFVESK